MEKSKAGVAAPAEDSKNFRTNDTSQIFAGQEVKFSCLNVALGFKLEGGRTKRRNEIGFFCPFHNRRKLSLWINTEKDCWKCFRCNKGGNRWELAAFLLGLEYPKDKEQVHFWLRNATSMLERNIIPFRSKKLTEKSPASSNFLTPSRSLAPGIPVVIHPPVAAVFGVTGAAILSEIHFLSRYRNKSSMYQPFQGWLNRITWLSSDRVRKSIRKLEKEGVILKDRSKYAIDYKVFNRRIRNQVQRSTIQPYPFSDDSSGQNGRNSGQIGRTKDMRNHSNNFGH